VPEASCLTMCRLSPPFKTYLSNPRYMLHMLHIDLESAGKSHARLLLAN
jgi:hypothetical protein